jgi:hypothetical protein
MLNMVRIILNNGWSVKDETLLEKILHYAQIEASQLKYVEWLRRREGEIPEALMC